MTDIKGFIFFNPVRVMSAWIGKRLEQGLLVIACSISIFGLVIELNARQ